ncbi:MAG: metallophosphoesterase [Spirochaetes bacterium]|nr:metallophosphoesterase [Spirochaetota bacterium]
MKIVHTCDIHLREDRSERWDGLTEIVRLCKEEDAGALVISGDLFDADTESNKLKADLRTLFSDLPFEIFIIPGNHDSQSFKDRAFFGSNVRVIHSPDDIYRIENIAITGIPFRNIREQELFAALQAVSSKLDPDDINLLLYHGELLDSYYSRSDFGEEGEARYMPARLDFFSGLNFDYVLAGHFHTNFNAWEFEKQGGKGYFIYPGSPVSITRRETGKRKVNIFEPGNPPQEVLLGNAYYYENLTVKLSPFDAADPVTAINENLSEIDSSAHIGLCVEGYLNSAKHGVDESSLNSFLESLKSGGRIESYIYRAVDLSTIFEDNIYKTFISKVDSGDYPEQFKNDMKEYLLKAMTD